MSWWMLKTFGQLLALGRELSELEYLWRVPHRISGEKLKASDRRSCRIRRCRRPSRHRLRELGYRADNRLAILGSGTGSERHAPRE